MDSRSFIAGVACGAMLGVVVSWLLWNGSDDERITKPELEPVALKTTLTPMATESTTSPESDAGGRRLSSIDQVSPQTSVSATPDDIRLAELGGVRAMIESGYMFSELVSTLALDAEMAEKLVNLLSGHLLESRENPPLVPAGQLQWNEHDKPDWVLKQEEEESRKNAEIAAFLGERRYGLFADYMESVEARRLMRQLQHELKGTPAAMAEEQLLPLVRAVAEGQERYVAERGKYASATGLERTARYHERMREAAQPYLSPQQFEHFSKYLEERYEAEERRVKERTSQAAARKSSER
jgi:hypothetical protein